MITHVTLPLTSLNSTSFITKLVFWIPFADGVGRVPTNGGGASGKKMQRYNNGRKLVIKFGSNSNHFCFLR